MFDQLFVIDLTIIVKFLSRILLRQIRIHTRSDVTDFVTLTINLLLLVSKMFQHVCVVILGLSPKTYDYIRSITVRLNLGAM